MVGREIRAVVLQLDHDLGAATFAVAGLDLIGARAIAGPHVAGLAGLPGVRVDADPLCDHERGVKSHAELPDEVGVLGAAFTEGLQKGLRARVGDGAEILDQLLPAHPDAEVLDGDRLGLVVRRDVDLEFQLFVEDLLLRELRMTEFFQRVRCVRHQLTDEDLLFRVERVDDDIEQLLDLGLEFELLRRGHGVRSVGEKGKVG